MNYLGDFAEDSTVRIVLSTNNSSGAAVAPSSAFEADDFRIYKNGSATQKTTTNGITIASPFDSVTGLHALEIDTSNDTGDSGFWTTAADYWVVAVPDETVNSQTVVQPIAAFSIQNRYMRGTDGANTTTPPTAAANATAVRSELGLTGSLDAAFDAIPTAAENGAAGWNRMLVDHTSTGSFGAAVGALSAGSGSGARTVTVTVNDGTTALQNARVRLTEGANTYVALTNASGVATFNLDDATYVVSITKQGYSYSGTTLVVNGTEAVTYSMSVVSITASDVDKVTGYWTVLDQNGNEASGIVVTVKARQANRASSGVLHDAAERTATSAVNGLVQFPNMIPGWRYSVVANDEYVADFVVPANAVTSVELGSIVARLS